MKVGGIGELEKLRMCIFDNAFMIGVLIRDKTIVKENPVSLPVRLGENCACKSWEEIVVVVVSIGLLFPTTAEH